MNLTSFGATGRTGQRLVTQALAAGHRLTALARALAKLMLVDDRLAVIPGVLGDAARVTEAVAGAEAVLSVLGPVSNRPDCPLNQGMTPIIAAMERRGVRRLVVAAGAAVADARDAPPPIHRLIDFLVRTLSRHVCEDMVWTAAAVRASDLDWTIVRAPRLTDGPARGPLTVGNVGRGVGTSLARADLAAFMLAQLTDDTYRRQAPAISH